MDKIKVNALCVRTADWNESDKILTLITAEHGKLTASARGVKNQKSKLKFAATPFSFGEYMLAPAKGGRFVVADCVQTDGFYDLTKNIENYYAGFIVLELLDKLSNEVPNPDLLVLALKTLSVICYGDEGAVKSLSQFLYGLLQIFGYGLNLESCAVCGKPIGTTASFDFLSGLICDKCFSENSVKVSAEVLKRLKSLASGEDITDADATFAQAYDKDTLEILLLIVRHQFSVNINTANQFLALV